MEAGGAHKQSDDDRRGNAPGSGEKSEASLNEYYGTASYEPRMPWSGRPTGGRNGAKRLNFGLSREVLHFVLRS